MHLKCLNKSPSLPENLISCGISSTSIYEQVDVLKEFFQSVFVPKQKLSITDIKSDKPIPTKFDLSKRATQKTVNQIVVTESCGPSGLSPASFQNKPRKISKILNKVFKKIKRLTKILDSWKMAADTPIHKKEERRKTGNYRPVFLVDIDCKIFEKCIYVALYNHFTFDLTERQHGFVRQRYVLSNMLSFLKQVDEALDSDPKSEILVFYHDFSKGLKKCLILNSSKKSPKTDRLVST